MCLDGEVRLVDGDDAYSGRVQIFHDNSWWTVCGHWGDDEARVLCHELGYTGVALSRVNTKSILKGSLVYSFMSVVILNIKMICMFDYFDFESAMNSEIPFLIFL